MSLSLKRYNYRIEGDTKIMCPIIEILAVITSSIYQIYFLLNNNIILVYYDIYRYSLMKFLFQSLFYILSTDFLLYLVHRSLHNKLLYKYIHQFHHTNINPTAFDFGSVHPLETIIVFSTFHIVPFTIPVHIMILELYIIHVGIRSLLQHGNGWKLMSNIPILKELYNNHHNIHHKYFIFNYGLGLFPTIYDKIFNTLLN